MSVIPSTTATITVGNVGTTLGNATKNMGGFRGFGGSVPASGAISMSQCQKIQYGVGYYNSWQTRSVSTNWGSWSSASIATNTSMTCSIWFRSTATFANWRNLFHVAASGAPDFPRYPSFYLEAGGTRILQDCTTGGSYFTGAINHNGQIYNLLVTYNGSTVNTYLNGSLAQTNTLTCAIGGTDVYGPDATYPNFANGSLNYLWFFPYPMNAAQVSAYYLSKVAVVGSPTSLAVSGYTWVPFAKLPQGFTLTAANGNAWYNNAGTLYDGSGSGGSPFVIYPTLPTDIYNGTREGSWYTLGNNAGSYARHAGFVMYVQAYSANNYDYAWGIYLQNGTTNKVIVYNPYPADNIGYWVQSSAYSAGRIAISTTTPASAQVYTISIPISL